MGRCAALPIALSSFSSDHQRSPGHCVYLMGKGELRKLLSVHSELPYSTTWEGYTMENHPHPSFHPHTDFKAAHTSSKQRFKSQPSSPPVSPVLVSLHISGSQDLHAPTKENNVKHSSATFRCVLSTLETCALQNKYLWDRVCVFVFFLNFSLKNNKSAVCSQ